MKEIKTKNDLVLDIPGYDDPGYLRRNMEIERIRQSNDLGKMIEYILEFVLEPEDREEARELLLDATQEEYDTIWTGLIGGHYRVNPQKAASSGNG